MEIRAKQCKLGVLRIAPASERSDFIAAFGIESCVEAWSRSKVETCGARPRNFQNEILKRPSGAAIR